MRNLYALFLLFWAFSLFGSQLQESKKPYSFRVAYGYASEKDLGDILLTLNFSKHPQDLRVVAVDGGYLLKENLFELPIDLYAKGGYSYFLEDKNRNVSEILAYVKILYNLDLGRNRIRFGFGEGVSYVSRLLEAEVYDATDQETGVMDPTAKFLNYLDITIDFDIGKMLHIRSLEDCYFGYLLKHRSGVFGLYSGVHGGSNYNSLYIEKNF